MNISRTGMVGLVIVLAVVLQVAVFNLFAVNGVVPNLALIVVVAAAIARGPQFGAVVGFTAGLLLDLAPPADHVAGRWALALVLVAILAGRVRDDARRSPIAALATVAVCSFIATSVFALSGVVLGDHALPAGEMMQVIAIALLWDVAVAPLLLPGLMNLFERTRPAELASLDDGRCPHPAQRLGEEPTAAVRRAGAGAVAVLHPVRTALVHAGRRPGTATAPRPPSSPCATSWCSRPAG